MGFFGRESWIVKLLRLEKMLVWKVVEEKKGRMGKGWSKRMPEWAIWMALMMVMEVMADSSKNDIPRIPVYKDEGNGTAKASKHTNGVWD